MKKKIKLRDLTTRQYIRRLSTKCKRNCEKCLFNDVYCGKKSTQCWITNKDLYSDKFLDQEVEIEVPGLLTKKEKEYLEFVIRPFKDKVEYIIKFYKDEYNPKEYIYISIKNDFPTYLPCFEPNKYYKGLERTKRYTLKDLGLFQSKYKITLTEFWNSKDKLAIHCDTEEKANKLLEAFDKLGKRWVDNSSYLKYNYYDIYKEKTCYSNDSLYCDLEFYIKDNYTIYEFEDVDLEN